MYRIILISTLLAVVGTNTLRPQAPSAGEERSSTTTEKNINADLVKTTLVSGRNEIPINSSLPLKGEVAVIGSQIFDGMNLYFNKLKKSLTSIPFMYDLDVLDDRAKVVNVRKNIATLKKKSPLFLSLLGYEAVDCLLEEQGDNRPAILFPLDGGAMHRTEKNKNIIFFRASHTQEITALVDYAIHELKEERFAIFYEASPWGEDARDSTREILKKYKSTALIESSYQQHTINVTQAVNDIGNKAPDCVICIAQSRPAYNFIRQLVNKGLYNTVFLGLSSLVTIQTPLKRSRGISVITTSVVPDPERSQLQIAKEYREDLKKYEQNKSPTSFSFEGYINAALLSESTKLVEFPITTHTLIEKIETLKKVKFKGLVLNFNPETRSLSQSVWINTGEDTEWIAFSPKKIIPEKRTGL